MAKHQKIKTKYSGIVYFKRKRKEQKYISYIRIQERSHTAGQMLRISKKVSEKKREYWATMAPEERDRISKKLSVVMKESLKRNPDTRKAFANYWKNNPSGAAKKEKARLEGIKRYYNNGGREYISRCRKDYWKNLSWEKYIQFKRKKSANLLERLEKMEKEGTLGQMREKIRQSHLNTLRKKDPLQKRELQKWLSYLNKNHSKRKRFKLIKTVVVPRENTHLKIQPQTGVVFNPALLENCKW